jgi:hypothetical protein
MVKHNVSLPVIGMLTLSLLQTKYVYVCGMKQVCDFPFKDVTTRVVPKVINTCILQ